MFRQAKWSEPLIYRYDSKGKIGISLPEIEDEIKRRVGDLEKIIPKNMLRNELKLPQVSEPEVVRHFIRLSQMNFSVDTNIYPLGSCTMKYNPKISEKICASDKISMIHPYQDIGDVQGILEILYMLGKWVCEITGMDYISLQPAAGAHGELTGVLIIRAYHID
ncbi:MAG: aminomethyl-transferring glycine dehydrogenase subunit GcvPB, partial [Thermoprotei archaeon]